MKVARSIAEFHEFKRAINDERTVGFVPTMGALHRGHLALVASARRRCDLIVMSIFVNPLQFGSSDDLDNYPRDETGDLAAAERSTVDVVFMPSVDEMYPAGESTTVDVGRLGSVVEGASRPGHFAGVATVVAKLFNIVRPDVAFFGQKDAQQVAVIEKMVSDLAWPVEIDVVPTVRERDGLALSSRNALLTPDERARALVLSKALAAGRTQLESGGDLRSAEKAMLEVAASEPAFDLDYAEVLDPVTFEEPTADGPVLLAIAGTIGNTRLIDNVLVDKTTAESA
ncbi:MAG: pantoate--beta-alanine ligase [Actinomycetota bacterium]|jgi:pantoate--beta-alanine ligase|nr:pantoate--beta-alanine ligase [Actinomycetota bacterium]